MALGHFLNADRWIDLEVMVILFPKSVGPGRASETSDSDGRWSMSSQVSIPK